MMEIRKLQGAEILDALVISSIAFEMNSAYIKLLPDMEAMRKGEKPLPSPTQNPDYFEVLWGAFNEEKELTAAITAIDFIQRYDGNDVKMMGIQAVCSLPEKRRGGAVREVLRAILRDARERSFPISYLYPFSNLFYNRLGYDMGCHVVKTRIPTASFLAFPRNAGSVRMIKRELLEDIKAVHNAFYAHYNGMVLRTDEGLWQKLLFDQDPIVSQRLGYLWYDEEGKPGAYVLFRTLIEEDVKVMNVQEICFTSPAALRGLFGFFNQFSAQYRFVEWHVPQDINLECYFQEPYDLTRSLRTRGQVRVLDVAQCLRLMRHPEGEGIYTLSVEDTLLPENTGVYRVLYSPKRVSVVKVESEPEDADLSLSIQALSTLVFGVSSLNGILARTDVTLRSNKDVLQRVFVQKPGYINDFF